MLDREFTALGVDLGVLQPGKNALLLLEPFRLNLDLSAQELGGKNVNIRGESWLLLQKRQVVRKCRNKVARKSTIPNLHRSENQAHETITLFNRSCFGRVDPQQSEGENSAE
jgi:hypothetical protein